jgi:hypothetical protein
MDRRTSVETAIMPFKVKELVEIIMKKKKISFFGCVFLSLHNQLLSFIAKRRHTIRYRANKHQLPPDTTLNLFMQKGVFEFLKENFDALHSQGDEYILTEIHEFINRKAV